jgi:hypothetical protein
MPVAVETAAPLGPGAIMLNNIGRRIRQESGDNVSIFHLLQHVSIVIEQGNADPGLGTLNQANFEPIFDFSVAFCVRNI